MDGCYEIIMSMSVSVYMEDTLYRVRASVFFSYLLCCDSVLPDMFRFIRMIVLVRIYLNLYEIMTACKLCGIHENSRHELNHRCVICEKYHTWILFPSLLPCLRNALRQLHSSTAGCDLRL